MAVREVLLVSLAGVASFLFINHENLYFDRPWKFADVRLESYLLATIVIYLFLRVVIIAAEMRPSKAHAELVRCPECGQWLDDPTAAGLQAHRRIELTPKPSPKEIVSAVALRKAVDATRIASRAGKPMPREDLLESALDVENVTSEDLVAALNDPDLLERLRHSPHPPREPKGPGLKR